MRFQRNRLNNAFRQNYLEGNDALFEDAEEGSIEDWANYFRDQNINLEPQYNEDKASTLCYDMIQSYSQADLKILSKRDMGCCKTKDSMLDQGLNKHEIVKQTHNYFTNKKKLMCMDLETNQSTCVYEA